APAAGNAAVIVRVSGPRAFTLERSYPLPVRPATQVLARRPVNRPRPGAAPEPRIAAPLRQRSRDGCASRARHRGRPAHPRFDRPSPCAARLQRLLRAVGGGGGGGGGRAPAPPRFCGGGG